MVGVVYFIVRKTITNSISNNFLRFMFFILPQKYLKAIKFNKKLVSAKISGMWAVTQIIYHLFN